MIKELKIATALYHYRTVSWGIKLRKKILVLIYSSYKNREKFVESHNIF